MTTKAKAPSRTTASPSWGEAKAALWVSPPESLEERLQRIRTMNERIRGYVEFLGAIDKLNGTSAEAKETAVAVFYERMVIMERQLGRILEDLRLG
jgi:hypothetical protein